MGIFRESKESTPNPNNSHLIHLPDETLRLLQLDKETIESHNKLIAERESIEKGQKYYQELSKNPAYLSENPVTLGEITFPTKTHDKSQLITELYSKFEEAKSMPQAEVLEAHLSGFSQGYAESAFEGNDWQTFVKSYDASTEGGIIQKPEAIQRLGVKYKDDKDTKLKIAEFIQQLIDTNKTTNPSYTNNRENEPNYKTPTPTMTVTPENAKPTPLSKEDVLTHPALESSATKTSPDFRTPTETPTQPNTPTSIPQTQTRPENTVTPTIGLAQTKPMEPILSVDGIPLRPVPPQPNG